mmetsp:Transcript_22677/g.25236  ORF Transcript_22677/g.25236 Transcript_22677/m.25236 type:complete len:132 (-) Transcript_22677:76-471(-)
MSNRTKKNMSLLSVSTPQQQSNEPPFRFSGRVTGWTNESGLYRNNVLAPIRPANSHMYPVPRVAITTTVRSKLDNEYYKARYVPNADIISFRPAPQMKKSRRGKKSFCLNPSQPGYFYVSFQQFTVVPYHK